MSKKTESNNILILGCGFSGMLTALAFARKGIKTTIIESKSTDSDSFFHDIRTTALTDASKNFLKDLLLWEEIKIVAGPITDIYVVDNKAPEMLHFASHQVNTEALGYILKNSDLKKILLSTIIKNPFVTLKDRCNYKLVESDSCGGKLHLEDGAIIAYDLLLICEGHNSSIKKRYFLRDTQKYYGQTALTFIVSHEKPHEGTAVEHFMPNGPFAILPLHDPCSSSIVWTLPKQQSELTINLPPDEFEYLVQRNFGDFLGRIKLDSSIAAYPLKAYLTHNYFHERIALIADSAHIIHPLAGQGLNMGIKDIMALTSLIKEHSISPYVLTEYQNSRQIDNKAMYLITDNLNRIFSNHSNILWHIRKTGLKIIDQFAPLKRFAIRYAMGKRFRN